MDTKKYIPMTSKGKKVVSVRRWTQLAIECYKRKDCVGCFYKEFFEERNIKCQMKFAVIESFRLFGKPPELYSSKTEE